MAFGQNNHNTRTGGHPVQSALQIQIRNLAQKFSDVRNAPAASSLTGRGSEVASFDFDNDLKAGSAQLCVGWVINYDAYKGIYRVQLGGKTVEITCTDNAGRGLPFAPGRPGMYPANSRVIVYCRGITELGYILGSVPDLPSKTRWFSENKSYAHANHMWHRIGCRKDLYHAKYAKQFPSRYSGDARPADTPALGDLNFSNFTGGLINLSMWQLVLRSSNACGIWMNLLDELMRQVSKNLQIWTPAGQLNKYVAAGETFNHEGQALYDWEALGLLKKPSGWKAWIDVDSGRNFDADVEGWTDNSYRTGVEPTGGDEGEKMHPFFRFEQFGGWFGHGGMREVKSLPGDGERINHMDKAKETANVYRQSVNVSGTFNLQAAGGFALERTVNMPCYWQKYEQFDNDGDRGNEDFKYLGDPEDETSTLQPAATEDLPEGVTQSVVKSLGAADYYARERYKPLYGFIRHEEAAGGRDYARADSGEGREPDALKPLLGALKGQQFIGDLKTISIKAELQEDQRTEYVKRVSGFYATQDGGFLLRDAYGNEIRTGANGIEFYSAADITSVAHRRHVTFAGDDMILNANKSLDMTAVQNDIRLQAFKNLEMTAAVSGQGRTLIENKGEGGEEFDAWVPDSAEDGGPARGEEITNRGIFLVAKKAAVVNYSRSLFTRCEKDSYFDCANSWNYASQKHETKAKQCVEMLIGDKDSQACSAGLVIKPQGEIALSNFFVKKKAYVHENLATGGNVILKKGLYVHGTACVGQSIVTARTVLEKMTDILRDDDEYQGCAAMAKEYTDSLAEAIEDVNKQTADELFEKAHALYEDEKVGNNATIERKQFSSRTQKQYGTEKFLFVMPEFICDGNNGSKIDDFALHEYYAKLSDKDEGPFPGRSRWEEACCAIPNSAFKGKDPYSLEAQNEVGKYAVPELKKPSEVFPAVVVPS